MSTGDLLSLYPSSPFNQQQYHQPVTHQNNHTTNRQTSRNTNPPITTTMMDSSSDEEATSKPSRKGSNTTGKSRRELPTGAVATLKAWLLSPEHFTHPYPTPQDQTMLMQKTGIDKKQLKNWFTNARRRIWKPMLKKQLEAGKLAATGGGGGLGELASGGGRVGASSATGGGGTITITVPQPPPNIKQDPAPQEEMYNNYQQAQQMQGQGNEYDQQQQQYQQYEQNGGQQYDQYGNPIYQQQQPQQQQQLTDEEFPNCNSIGSLAPMQPASMSSIGSFGRMFKTDSHAVLMELFARDQDLVRQAAGNRGGMIQAAAIGNSNTNNATATANVAAAAAGGGNTLQAGNLRYPTNVNSNSPQQSSSVRGMGQKQQSVTFDTGLSNGLSSWPHFSSVSSLNNMGGLKGVKSITNLSAADLSSQGNLNKMGNLAHVKSSENMGRGDSYAFLEVFFDDRSSGMIATSSAQGNNNGQRGVKREREDDDAIGLSLDGDDGTSPGQFNNSKPPASEQAPPTPNTGVPTPAPLPENGTDDVVDDGGENGGGTLKRAYDDALAARGLIAVRQSCEKLTDLDLPNKMQRTISQEYIRQHTQGQHMGDFFSSNNSQYAPNSIRNVNSQQFSQQLNPTDGADMSNASVEVPSSTKCALCMQVTVDTQLRPCGHMFHGRCLKPSLSGMCPPKCPLCNVSMQSAILAVPSAATDIGAAVAGGV